MIAKAKREIKDTRPFPVSTADVIYEYLEERVREILEETVREKTCLERPIDLITPECAERIALSKPRRSDKQQTCRVVTATALAAIASLNSALPASPTVGEFLVASTDDGVSRPMFDIDEVEVQLPRAVESLQPWNLSKEDSRLIVQARKTGSARPRFKAPKVLPYDED